MLRVLGKPLLEYSLRHLACHGVEEARLTLGYLPEKVMEIGRIPDLGLKLDFYTEDRPLGTAGSVARAAGDLKETFFVISGDALTDMDFSAALAFHKKRGALCTCILHREADPSRFGVAVTDEHGRVHGFQEKPGAGEAESFAANTGLYILEPQALSRIPRDRAFDFARDLFPILVEEGSLFGFLSEGYWSDVGSPSAFLQAQEDLMLGKVRFSFPQGQFAPKTVGEDCVVAPSALLLPPVFLGNACRIGEGCVIGPDAVLEGGCIVEDRCGVKGSLVGRGSRLSRNAQLRRAILAEDCRCGEDSRIFEGAVMGRGAELGTLATLLPDVRVWPGKRIASRDRVRESVIYGQTGKEQLLPSGVLRGTLGRDLPLSFLSRIGMAWAKILPRSARVGLSGVGGSEAKTALAVLAAALNERSIGALDVGEAPLCVLAPMIPVLHLHGAVHVAASGRDLTLRFLGGEGFPPDPSAVRKMEDALERMGEEEQAGDVGRCLAMDGLRGLFLRRCERIYGRPSACVAFEFDDAEMTSLFADAGFRQPGLGEKPIFALRQAGEDWRLHDEKGKALEPVRRDAALWQALIQTGSFTGQLPIPASVWSRALDALAQDRGLRLLRVSSRGEFWQRALIRAGHSAAPGDMGPFFSAPLAALCLARALREAAQPFSRWLLPADPDRTVLRGEYDRGESYEVMEKLQTLKAEAAETFEGGMTLPGDGDVVLEYNGAQRTVTLHGKRSQRAYMQALLEGLTQS